MSRRVFRIGHVTSDAKGLAFAPQAEAVFDCNPEEEVEIALTYAYDERSRAMERFHVRLTVEADGAPPGVAEAQVQDRPGLGDSERGALTRVLSFGRAGLYSGKFLVEAEYAAGPWSSQTEPTVARLKETGRFFVRVH